MLKTCTSPVSVVALASSVQNLTVCDGLARTCWPVSVCVCTGMLGAFVLDSNSVRKCL